MIQIILQWLLPVRLLMSGRMNSTSYNKKNDKEETIHYSSYSEWEYMHEDKNLFVRFVCTFGLERLPSGNAYSSVGSRAMRQWYADGLVPWVGEIYFLNYGDKDIHIKPISLEMRDQAIHFDEPFDVQPGGMGITAPLVILASNFGKEFEVGLSFEYEGQVFDFKGTAVRLSVEELRSKYNN